MKHVIIEGCDRVGKNALTTFLLQKSTNAILRHFTSPKGTTHKEQQKFQENIFLWEFRFSLLRFKLQNLSKTESDLLIWNRSHIGEMVYGPMYRNTPGDWIYDLEKSFSFQKYDDIYLILLTADSDFLIKNDDGLSFSTKKEDKEKELQLFQEAFDKSLIKNKLLLKVNKGNEFIPKQIRHEQVYNFIYKQ